MRLQIASRLKLVVSLAVMFVATSYCFAGGFLPAVNYPTGANPYAVAIADFNGDGKRDLAVLSNLDGTISVLLGKEDGTFLTGRTVRVCRAPISIGAGDLNGDGRADLAVTCAGAPHFGVTVVLNGNKGFLPPESYPSGGSQPDSLAIADFDGDGILDLMVADVGSIVSFMKGRGDGSFQSPQIYATPPGPSSIIAADFNRDGSLDVAVTGCELGVCILLGNGDGTFQSALTFDAGDGPLSLAAGDFNRDGSLDLAVANSTSNTSNHFASIVLGNGDGTFQSPVAYDVGIFPKSVAVADFNNDGALDVAVTVAQAGSVTVMYGQGDGTFPHLRQFAAGAASIFVAVADLNYDQAPDLVIANHFSNNLSVLMNSGGTFVTATSSQNPSPVGQPVTFTVTVDPSLLAAIPTGKVVFKDGATVLGTVSLDPSGQASFTTSSLTLGTHTIQTKYSGDGNYNPNTGKPITQVVQ